jgi:hypothetical protein
LRVSASNQAGSSTTFGYSDPSIVISSTAPTVTTGGNSISQVGGTVSGSANPNWLSTQGWFEVTGPGIPGTLTTTHVALGAGGPPAAAVPFSGTVSGLSQNSAYTYKAAASNATGNNYGSAANFYTQVYLSCSGYSDQWYGYGSSCPAPPTHYCSGWQAGWYPNGTPCPVYSPVGGREVDLWAHVGPWYTSYQTVTVSWNANNGWNGPSGGADNCYSGGTRVGGGSGSFSWNDGRRFQSAGVGVSCTSSDGDSGGNSVTYQLN